MFPHHRFDLFHLAIYPMTIARVEEKHADKRPDPSYIYPSHLATFFESGRENSGLTEMQNERLLCIRATTSNFEELF